MHQCNRGGGFDNAGGGGSGGGMVLTGTLSVTPGKVLTSGRQDNTAISCFIRMAT
jgi:hypothetical protein